MRYLFLLLLLPVVPVMAQNAVIREVERPFTTYPYSDPDPVARTGRVYPYFRFDGFTSKSEVKNWKMVELENDYIRLAVMPEMGGKVWEAIEKSQNYPFVFSTHVVKFRDISLRGAWTTGGLEFNFGDIGHATTASTPVDYFTRTNPDGSVSCFIGATEWASRTTWRIEIRLEPDKAYFTTRAWWTNDTPVEQEFYHWVNAGFKAKGNLEFIFPGTHHIGHGGEFDTWPVDSAGRNLAFYEKNNFGSYKSYHVIGRPSNIYGGYWHDDEMGFGRYAPYYEKLGKKVWILGLSQEGARWENLLGDNDGLNVELQSGRLFNQAARGSELTPFRHVGFAPYSTDTWSDSWFPVKHTRGMTNASLRGVLNIRKDNGWLKVDWMSLENQSDTLDVYDSGRLVISKKMDLKPMQLYRDSLKWEGNTENLSVYIGKDIVTADPGKPLERPLTAPAGFNRNSEFGLLIEGTDLSRQKNYKEAEVNLLKALELNPYLVPALTQMAQLRYRQGLYDQAREYAGKALSVDTYDPAANYFWGLASEKTGKEADAFDGYSVATLSPEYRHAAWFRIACLKMKQGNWNEAGKVIAKCLDNYPPDENAWLVKALVERKKGNMSGALSTLKERITADPLDHMAYFEKYLNTGSDQDRMEFVRNIRQEMPQETFLEIALKYYDWNLEKEAALVLANAPVHPMVQLFQAWLLNRAGNKTDAENRLTLAMAASPEFVFPFRPELTGLFEWADSLKPDWKWKYYEALVKWQNNLTDEARALFNSCGQEPDFVPFYLAKAELFEVDSVIGASLWKAWSLDKNNWRTGIKLARYCSHNNDQAKALDIATINFKAHPSSSVVGLQYAQMLKMNRKYTDALKVLTGLKMLPAEGDVDAHSLWRETNMLFALELMKTGKYKSAMAYLRKAEEWPENLFSGEPYLADNRVTRFLYSWCSNMIRDYNGRDNAFRYIADYRNPDGWTSNYGNKLTVLITGGSRDYKALASSLLSENIKDRDNNIIGIFREILK